MELKLVYNNNKCNVVYNDTTKTVDKNVFFTTIFSVLEKVSPDRDYTSISSLKKLFKVLEIEMSPDESDDEDDSDNEQDSTPPVKARATRKYTPRTKTQIVKKEQSDESEESE